MFQSQEKLLSGLPDLTGGFYLYERDSVSGQTQLVNATGGGNVLEDGATLGNGGFERLRARLRPGHRP